MRWLQTLIFALRARLNGGSRIALGAYLKGHRNIQFGVGCKIQGTAGIDATHGPVVLGDKVTLNRYSYVQGGRGGVRLGRQVEINNFSIVNGTGGVEIGDDTLIGPGVRIISYQHGIAVDALIRTQPLEGKPIVIGKDVWIGANAVILAGVTVGDGAVVAAGAVVTKDVAPGEIVVGVPARVVRNRK